MNGFCGWLNWNESNERQRDVLQRMVSRLDPAATGTASMVVRDSAAVAVSGGQSTPAVWERDGYCVVLQGHVYLTGPDGAGRLCDPNHAAPLLLDLYREHGPRLLDRLGGGFALAIISRHGEDSLLAIDRIGGRFPLSYRVLDGTVIFATRSDAIEAHPLGPTGIDPQSVYNYLYCHVVPSPRSFHAGVRHLTPASYLQVRNGSAQQATYWKPVYRPDKRTNLRELSEEFRGLIRKCVDRYAHDVKVGCFLSGGTDSSTIAGYLGDVSGSPARTYSIGFRAAGYDEMEYARTAAAQFGTSHHEYYVSADDVLRAIPRVAMAYAEPFGNASAVPTYYCARLAREDGVERLLGGDGGDELFAGNRRYAFQKTLGFYDQVPPFLRRLLELALLSFSADASIAPIRKARSYIGQAKMRMPLRLQSYNYLERDDPASILDPDYLRLIDVEEPRNLQAEVYDSAQADTMLDRMLALDLKFTLADDDLPKVSRMCDAAGLDVAYPFLCEEMVAFSCRVPDSLKLRGLKLRWFMKHALRDFLPEKILRKTKHGFGLPFGIWMREHPGLRDFARGNLEQLKTRKLLRADYIDELIRLHDADHATYYGVMIWVLMMLEQWFQREQPIAIP